MFPFKSQLPIAGTALKLGLGFVIFQFKAFILYTKFLSVVARAKSVFCLPVITGMGDLMRL